MPRTGLSSDQLLLKIIQLAEQKIRDLGFKRLTLTQLANDLGVSHAALYKHVASKEALLDLISEKWLMGIDEQLKSISQKPMDAYECLLKWFITYHQLKRNKVRNDPEIYKTFNMAVEKKKEFVQQHLKELNSQLTYIVERGKAEHMFDRFSTKKTVDLLLKSTLGFHHPFLIVEQQHGDRILELKNLIHTMVQGLKTQQQT